MRIQFPAGRCGSRHPLAQRVPVHTGHGHSAQRSICVQRVCAEEAHGHQRAPAELFPLLLWCVGAGPPIIACCGGRGFGS